MADKTIIAWTDHTLNPWMGCEKISSGCLNCYAASFVENRMGLKLWGKKAPRQKTKSPWANVRRWNKSTEKGVLGDKHPKLVFVGSLMDWAEDKKGLDEIRVEMWKTIRENADLHFQLLTKRPENIFKFLPDDWGDGYKNVWLGTTIENEAVSFRADILREIPCFIRFISYEPAIGNLDNLDLKGFDWVIYGGESGSGYRKEDKNWARTMHKKCSESGIAFFHKQSSGYRTELGIDLDGKIVREFPYKRLD